MWCDVRGLCQQATALRSLLEFAAHNDNTFCHDIFICLDDKNYVDKRSQISAFITYSPSWECFFHPGRGPDDPKLTVNHSLINERAGKDLRHFSVCSPHFIGREIEGLKENVTNQRWHGLLESGYDCNPGTIVPNIMLAYSQQSIGARHCPMCLRDTRSLNPQKSTVRGNTIIILHTRHKDSNCESATDRAGKSELGYDPGRAGSTGQALLDVKQLLQMTRVHFCGWQ